MTDQPDFRAALPARCDVVVVGAGPAGLCAALGLVRSGAGTVVLLDRRDPWREPVSCAEAVHRVAFDAVAPLPTAPWVRGPVDHCLFASENASMLWTSPGDGYIIDRARMHRDLALACRDEGVLCHFRTRASSVGPLVGDERTLEIELDGIRRSLRTRCVVDASGPGKGLERGEGLADGTEDLETAAFTLMHGVAFDPTTIQLWYGSRFAPGGYGWVFPSGDGRANVGVVCARGSGLSSREGLARFLGVVAPGRTAEAVWGGAIPCGSGSGTLASDMLFKAGDCASMVNGLSRAGIVEAMEAGTLAARHADRALKARTPGERMLQYRLYRWKWFLRRGFAYRLTMAIKPWFGRIPDDVLDLILSRLGRRPSTKHTWSRTAWELLRILPLTFGRAPRRAGPSET